MKIGPAWALRAYQGSGIWQLPRTRSPHFVSHGHSSFLTIIREYRLGEARDSTEGDRAYAFNPQP